METTPVLQKREALRFFIDHLCQSEVKESIIKIVLFGSVARGDCEIESDVDLLVFATDRLDDVSQACAEASLCTGIETKESVEPLVRGVDVFFIPTCILLMHSLEGGRGTWHDRGGGWWTWQQGIYQLTDDHIYLISHDSTIK